MAPITGGWIVRLAAVTTRDQDQISVLAGVGNRRQKTAQCYLMKRWSAGLVAGIAIIITAAVLVGLRLSLDDGSKDLVREQTSSNTIDPISIPSVVPTSP